MPAQVYILSNYNSRDKLLVKNVKTFYRNIVNLSPVRIKQTLWNMKQVGGYFKMGGGIGCIIRRVP
jgi:hypothetical protein